MNDQRLTDGDDASIGETAESVACCGARYDLARLRDFCTCTQAHIHRVDVDAILAAPPPVVEGP